MTHMDTELEQLKDSINEMMGYACIQLKKAKSAFIDFDLEIAEEIIHNEKRINALEIGIDRDIENIFALFQPVASDLRFVISMLKINSDLERIGDYADGIADYIVDLNEPFPPDTLDKMKVGEMFDAAISMMINIRIAFEKNDTTLARKVFKQDSELNKLNKNASKVIAELILADQRATRSMLYLFSTIRKLERAGDHIKNIAEDIIFYNEAEIIRHKKIK